MVKPRALGAAAFGLDQFENLEKKGQADKVLYMKIMKLDMISLWTSAYIPCIPKAYPFLTWHCVYPT